MVEREGEDVEEEDDNDHIDDHNDEGGHVKIEARRDKFRKSYAFKTLEFKSTD